VVRGMGTNQFNGWAFSGGLHRPLRGVVKPAKGYQMIKQPDDMINRLRTYKNGVHGAFFLEVADELKRMNSALSAGVPILEEAEIARLIKEHQAVYLLGEKAMTCIDQLKQRIVQSHSETLRLMEWQAKLEDENPPCFAPTIEQQYCIDHLTVEEAMRCIDEIKPC